MGAWGVEIMASDNALDALDMIKDICKGNSDEDSYYDDLTRDELNQNMAELMEKYGDTWDQDLWNVLAYQIITTGADMCGKIKIRAIQCVDEDVSDWSEPEDRMTILEELRNAVEYYQNGNKMELTTDIGLLNKIAKGMKNK